MCRGVCARCSIRSMDDDRQTDKEPTNDEIDRHARRWSRRMLSLVTTTTTTTRPLANATPPRRRRRSFHHLLMCEHHRAKPRARSHTRDETHPPTHLAAQERTERRRVGEGRRGGGARPEPRQHGEAVEQPAPQVRRDGVAELREATPRATDGQGATGGGGARVVAARHETSRHGAAGTNQGGGGSRARRSAGLTRHARPEGTNATGAKRPRRGAARRGPRAARDERGWGQPSSGALARSRRAATCRRGGDDD